MKSFLKVHFFKGIGELKPHMESIKPVDMNVSSDKFMLEVTRCIKESRLVPISLEIIVPDVGTHANMILIVALIDYSYHLKLNKNQVH